MRNSLTPILQHLCILEYRAAVLPAEPRGDTAAYPEGGCLLFDLNLSLPAGTGTWFDLVHGTYFIDIAAQDSSPVEVRSVPEVPGEPWIRRKVPIHLPAQTRLAISNPAQAGSATVSVKILRVAVAR